MVEQPDMQIIMRREIVRLIPCRSRVVCHVVVFAAAIFWRLLVGSMPRFGEHQQFYPGEPLSTCYRSVIEIEQDGRGVGPGICSGSVDPLARHGRPRWQAQEIAANIMNTHRTIG